MAGALWRFWMVRGYETEGRGWLDALLTQNAGVTAVLQAKVVLGAAWLSWILGDSVAAHPLFEQSLALYRALGEKWGIGVSLAGLGHLARDHGEYDRAVALLTESLVLAREMKNNWLIAFAQVCLAHVANLQGGVGQTRELLQEALVLFRELGDKRGIAIALCCLGQVARHDGDLRVARALVEEGLAMARLLGDSYWIAASLGFLGRVMRGKEDHAAARSYYEESLVRGQGLGALPVIVHCLGGLAGVAGAQGEVERAARLFGAAEALRKDRDLSLLPLDRADHERDVAAVCAMLEEEAFATAWEEGRGMSLEEAVDYALQDRDNVPDGVVQPWAR